MLTALAIQRIEQIHVIDMYGRFGAPGEIRTPDPWFVESMAGLQDFCNQLIAALANPEPSYIKAQTWHIKARGETNSAQGRV